MHFFIKKTACHSLKKKKAEVQTLTEQDQQIQYRERSADVTTGNQPKHHQNKITSKQTEEGVKRNTRPQGQPTGKQTAKKPGA
jgi:hypothetical protein